MKQTKKPLSILLALCLIAGLLPWTVMPARADGGVSYINASGTTQTCESYTALTTETTWTGWYVVSGDVTIDTRIIVSGEAHLILCDGATLTAGKGIAVNGGNSLTIYGQSGGTGKLTATGKEKGHAGIGGNSNSAGGTITINGGMVTANGGENGAGIGGGWLASGGTVTINGGMVTANGGKYGAGIGGGSSGNGGIVTITDGVVTARGGRNGAGIGGGDGKNGGTTIITGGTVTANGGDNGKGIGCGIRGSGGTTTISLTSANDSIYANSYSGSVSVAQGKALWNGSETLSGTLSDLRMVDGKTLIMSGAYFISVSSPATGRVTAPTAALPGSTVTLEVIPNTNYSIAEVRYNDGTDHTITPVNDIYSFVMPAKDVTVSADFSFTPNSADLSVSGDVYIIHTAVGWDMFCDLLTGDTLNGKTVKLADDFNNAATPVTSMAGTSDHRFKGTFDGNSKTLTVNLNASTDNCAPFGYIEDATIKDLNIAGSITTTAKCAASIAAHTYGTTSITNCHSTVTITGNKSGDGTHGGFVAVNESGGTLNFSDCSFKGSMLGTATSNGGFVGYNSGTQINYTDCLFAPTEITMSTTSSCTFNRNGKNSLTRAYYAQAFGTAEGTLVYTSAPAGVTTEQVTAADGQTYYYEIDRRITSASEWNSFAEAVNGGNTFSGKTVVLGADIEVSTMVGTENNKFNGTFDGGGHTITFNLTDAPQHTALFAYVNGATIQNLNVAGAVSSSTDHIAVLISEPSGTVRVTDVTISANISGTDYCGGFSTGGTGILFTRCVYNGKINASNNSGGFCGWGTNTTTLTDCIFAPTEGSSISGGGNFCNNTVGTVTRSYYTLQVGTSTQGKMAYAAVPNNTVYGALTVAGTTVYPPVAISGVKSSYIATGSNIHPEPTVTATDGTVLTKGTHYTVTYSQENDAAAGNYTLTVTGVSPYSGSQIISYEVKSVNLNITSDTQWNQFAENVNNGEDYDGVTVTLGNNIAVSTMVGTSDHRFKGTFDGGTHTITFTKADATTDNCAPFGYIEDATIKDLNIAGSITTTAKCAASIAAHTYGTTSITNCHSTVTITGNKSGDGTHGGFVAVNESGGTLNFSDCSFKGSMLGTATSNGGFVGYNSGTKINYTDCLFAPTEITMSTTSSCTFNRNGKNSFTRAYYTQTFGTAEGNKVYTSAPAGTITEQVIAADGSSYYMVTGWQTISVIASADDWRAFADSVNIGNVDYSGVTVTLGADISASTMAGTSSNPFKGTFDGGGHTLTLSLTNDGSECTAPFRYVNGATITMLRTAGTVNGGSQILATGLIGKSAGTVNITACRSSVQITSSISGDATCGGFIGEADGTVTFANCLFDGSITGASATKCGGFVGWRKGTLTFNNCLMAGTMSLSDTSGSATFYRNASATLTKCYYRTAYGDTQGEAVGSTTNETLIDNEHLGSSWEISGESVVPVMGKKTIVLATVSGLYRNYLYTGNEISISYTVTDGNTELVKGTDYTETITKGGNASNVQEKGDYTLTISGIGNYRGSRTFRFTVRDAIEYRDSDGTTKTVNPQEVTAITEDNKPTTLSAGWYFVQESTTISSRITVSGSVNLILSDGTTLTVPKGIRVEGSNSLTIYGQSEGNGALTINGVDYYNAGIGGNNKDSTGTYDGQDAGNITIHGGIITVTGGQYGAGIGGGGTNGINRSGGSGGNITIDGGTVTAYGNTSAAIGGGGHGASSITGGSGGNITISGGKVTAYPGFSGGGQGIGGCFGNSSGSITLSCVNADDFIQSSSYVGTVTVANGVTLYDDAGHAYTGTLDDTQKSAIVDKMGLGYAVSISFPIAHGTVAADKAGVRAAAENKTVTLTLTADTGYHTDTVSYNDGSSHTVTPTGNVYSFTMPAANVTATATFMANTYTVKFNGNGATSGSMSNQSFTYDAAQNLTANGFNRTFTVTYDYNNATGGNTAANSTATATFDGWATSENGAKVYDDGASVSNLIAENNATFNLYAKWTDGSVVLPTPIKAKHVFFGWYSDSGLQTKVGDGGAAYTPTGDVTLYAKWLVPADTPAAIFTANGADSGTLTNVTDGMKYQIASGEWQSITGTSVELTGLSVCTIKVYQPGDGTTTTDSAEQTINVTKAATPTTPSATDCTTANNNDGKLTGVTTAMEYKVSTADSWTDGTGSDITGLTPATYYVRVKASGTALASANQTLTIAAYTAPNQVAAPTFSLAAGNYTGTQSVTISCETDGATIHYTTDGSTPTASSPTYSAAISVSSTTSIKAIAVKSGWTDSAVATATYTINTPPTVYTVTVNSGSGSGNYAAGATVTITANAPATGKVFDKWTTNDGVTFASATSATTTFTMPAKAVTVTATYKNATYTVTLNTNGGKINSGNVTSYTYGTETTLPTNVTKTGYRFDGWYANDKFTGSAVTKIGANETGDKTFYAKWTLVPSLANGKVTAPKGAVLILAEYEASGRMKSMRSVTLTADCVNADAAKLLGVTLPGSYKLMLVNKTTFAPLCAAWEKKA